MPGDWIGKSWSTWYFWAICRSESDYADFFLCMDDQIMVRCIGRTMMTRMMMDSIGPLFWEPYKRMLSRHDWTTCHHLLLFHTFSNKSSIYIYVYTHSTHRYVLSVASRFVKWSCFKPEWPRGKTSSGTKFTGTGDVPPIQPQGKKRLEIDGQSASRARIQSSMYHVSV